MNEPTKFVYTGDHLDLLLATSDIGLWEFDLETGVANRNLRHDQIFGYTQLLPGWTDAIFLSHIVADDRDRIQQMLASAHTAQTAWGFEAEILTAQGDQRWIRAQCNPKMNDAGQISKLVGHVIDISEIKRNEERLKILTNELNHRVKNMLGIVQSLARQSFGPEAPGVEAFASRLCALAAIHDSLLRSDWAGTNLKNLIEDTLKWAGTRPDELAITGPPIAISPNIAISMALAFNELCTNALKYGALGDDNGKVTLMWSITDETLTIIWQERGGPAPPATPTTGFGTLMLQAVLASDIEGQVDLDFAPEGLTATIRGPLKSVVPT